MGFKSVKLRGELFPSLEAFIPSLEAFKKQENTLSP